MNAVLNTSAYRFVSLTELPKWRERIREQALRLHLKGTVLLAEEGINLFLAGEAEQVRSFFEWLRSQPPLSALEVKESWSEEVPFKRLLVKVKAEIIRMNQPTIQPQAGRARSVDPITLQRWLDTGQDDEGRAVLMLDTRNAFEVAHGRFNSATDWQLQRFSEFPQALDAHRDQLSGKTIVSYCTGGIRCEKAALWMEAQGIDRVLQLEGGILAFLEKTSGRHFEGNCFVFDSREALDDTLTPAAVPDHPA